MGCQGGPWEELTFGADLTDDSDGQVKSGRTFQTRGPVLPPPPEGAGEWQRVGSYRP